LSETTRPSAFIFNIYRVASRLEKSGKFDIFSRSGNFEKWSVKNKNPQKSGKIILKDTFCYITSIGYGSLLALNSSLTSILL